MNRFAQDTDERDRRKLFLGSLDHDNLTDEIEVGAWKQEAIDKINSRSDTLDDYEVPMQFERYLSRASASNAANRFTRTFSSIPCSIDKT